MSHEMDIVHLRNRNRKRDALMSTLVAFLQLWQKKKTFIMIKKNCLFPFTQVDIVHERVKNETTKKSEELRQEIYIKFLTIKKFYLNISKTSRLYP